MRPRSLQPHLRVLENGDGKPHDSESAMKRKQYRVTDRTMHDSRCADIQPCPDVDFARLIEKGKVAIVEGRPGDRLARRFVREALKEIEAATEKEATRAKK